MLTIVATVLGVILTALIGYGVATYRSMITYEKTEVPVRLSVKDGKIVSADDDDGYFEVARIMAYHVKLENRGWKPVANAKFHIPRMAGAFSLYKSADTISPESIKIGTREDSLEVEIAYLPRKEKVVIAFSNFNSYLLNGVTGVGEAFECRSIAYYRGYKTGLRYLMGILLLAAGGSLAGFVLQRVFS